MEDDPDVDGGWANWAGLDCSTKCDENHLKLHYSTEQLSSVILGL